MISSFSINFPSPLLGWFQAKFKKHKNFYIFAKQCVFEFFCYELVRTEPSPSPTIFDIMKSRWVQCAPVFDTYTYEASPP